MKSCGFIKLATWKLNTIWYIQCKITLRYRRLRKMCYNTDRSLCEEKAQHSANKRTSLQLLSFTNKTKTKAWENTTWVWITTNQQVYGVNACRMPSLNHTIEEKSGIIAVTRVPGARLGTKLSLPHLFPLRAIYLHAPAFWDLFDVITWQIPLMQSGFKEPWLLISTQHHPLLPWQPSASPLLGKPKGFIRFIRDHSSKLLSSDPHRGGTRSRVDARGRPKARSDLPVIRWVFAQDCVRANARAGDPEWFTVSCEWPHHYGALNGLEIHITFDDSSLSSLYTHTLGSTGTFFFF